MKISGLINREYVNTVIKERPRDVHKGNCGKVLIAAGSVGMAGAAVLASRAAMKAGSGLVTVSISRELFSVIQISVPEVICTGRDLSAIKPGDYDAVAIGPGMRDGEDTKEFLESILRSYRGKLIIDADGLNVIAKYNMAGLVKSSGCSVIVSPHAGEAKRLMASDWHDGITRLETAERITELLGSVTVIKGPDTLVATADGIAYTNTTGNQGMATAGSGDVLTGIITSLAGQGLSPCDAAKAGVYIHGAAGDLAAEEKGEYGMMAGDIVRNIPYVIKSII